MGKAFIKYMRVTVAEKDSGFKSLVILRSDDETRNATNWKPVRADGATSCEKNRKTDHQGWEQATRHIMIAFKDHCGQNSFAVTSWEVYGIEAEVLPPKRVRKKKR